MKKERKKEKKGKKTERTNERKVRVYSRINLFRYANWWFGKFLISSIIQEGKPKKVSLIFEFFISYQLF